MGVLVTENISTLVVTFQIADIHIIFLIGFNVNVFNFFI